MVGVELLSGFVPKGENRWKGRLFVPDLKKDVEGRSAPIGSWPSSNHRLRGWPLSVQITGADPDGSGMKARQAIGARTDRLPTPLRREFAKEQKMCCRRGPPLTDM